MCHAMHKLLKKCFVLYLLFYVKRYVSFLKNNIRTKISYSAFRRTYVLKRSNSRREKQELRNLTATCTYSIFFTSFYSSAYTGNLLKCELINLTVINSSNT